MTTKRRTRKTGTKADTEHFKEMLAKSEEEVEEYLLERYKEEYASDLENLPTPREILFCEAYMAHSFNMTKTAAEIWPNCSDPKIRARDGEKMLEKERVQNYLSRELHLKRLRLGITQDWLTKKYLTWANLDITNFLQFVPAKGKGTNRRAAAVYLKDDIENLPPMVRQCIKSVTVDDKGKVKVEFIDQKSALDSLAKLLGFGNDKLKIDTDGQIHVHFDGQDAGA